MKKLKLQTLFIFFAGVFCLLSHAIADSSEEPLDNIAAYVNHDVITESEVNTQIKGILANLKMHNRPQPSQEELRKQVLDQLIIQTLQLQIAKQQGITITDRDVTQTIRAIAAQNHIDFDQMRKALEKSGVDFMQYRKQIKDQLLVRAVQQQYVAAKISISPADIENYIKKIQNDAASNPYYHLELITLPLPENLNETNVVNEKAEEIMKALNQGTDMQIAAINASTPSLLIQDQDIGWHQLTEMPPAVQSQLLGAKNNDIIGPVQADDAIYIAKVLEIKTRKLPKNIIDEYHLRQIFIRADPATKSDDAKLTLDQIQKKLAQGASFTNLAKQYSQNEARSQGGDLGWLAADKIDSVTLANIKNLKPNEISAPYQVKGGWMITQLLEHRQRDVTTQTLTEQVKQYLYTQRADKILKEWVAKLRKESYIKIVGA